MSWMAPSLPSVQSNRKRSAEAHSLAEMCLTSGRRAFLSFLWTGSLLRSAKRRRMVGGEVPWSGFSFLQHSYLHWAVIGASKTLRASGKAAVGHSDGRSSSASGARRRRCKRDASGPTMYLTDTVDDNTLDASDTTMSKPSDVEVGGVSVGAAPSLDAASRQPRPQQTTCPDIFSYSDDGSCGSLEAQGRGLPSALRIAGAGTPLLAAFRARRLQPMPTDCVATTEAGPSTNLHPLTAADLGRLLRDDVWLNDEVINFYMLLIMKRGALSHGESGSRFEAEASTCAASRPVDIADGAAVAIPRSRGDGSAAAVTAAAKTAAAAAILLPTRTAVRSSPLKSVMSAVAAAASNCSSAAAATAAAAAAAASRLGLGAVVASGMKRLAAPPPPPPQEQLREQERAAASAPATVAGKAPRRPSAADVAAAAATPLPQGPAAAADAADADLMSGLCSSLPCCRSEPLLSPPRHHHHHHQQQQQQQPPQPPQFPPPCTAFAFNSFFFSKLTAKGNRNRFAYDEVRRWTLPCRTHTADCVLTRDLLLFPINHDNCHWCLAAIWPRRRVVQYYDSLGGGRSTADWVMETLLRWLLMDAENKGVSLGAEVEGHSGGRAGGSAMAAGRTRARTVAGGWRREEFSELRIPKQLDHSSCGVFVCAFAELLVRGVPPHAFGFTQADVPALRRGMAEQILRGAL